MGGTPCPRALQRCSLRRCACRVRTVPWQFLCGRWTVGVPDVRHMLSYVYKSSEFCFRIRCVLRLVALPSDVHGVSHIMKLATRSEFSELLAFSESPCIRGFRILGSSGRFRSCSVISIVVGVFGVCVVLRSSASFDVSGFQALCAAR